VTSETMMEDIINNIKLTDQLIGNTGLCFETEFFVYQICYLDYSDKRNENEKIPNGICSALLGDDMWGDCVFICSRITENNTCVHAEARMDDLVSILYKKYVHKGIIVGNDNVLRERKFIELVDLLGDNGNSYKMIEVPFLGFNLICYFKIVGNGVANKIASRLIGNNIVHGEVVIVMKSSETEYQDLTAKLFKKMIDNCWGPYCVRNLDDNEKNKKNDGLQIVMNKHCVLDKRNKNNRDFCEGCREKLNNKYLLCGGCYRIRYNDEKCKIDDWPFHKEDCLLNKKPLN